MSLLHQLIADGVIFKKDNEYVGRDESGQFRVYGHIGDEAQVESLLQSMLDAPATSELGRKFPI